MDNLSYGASDSPPETMAAPAEISRPARRIGTSGTGDPFLIGLVLFAFAIGLYMLAKGVLMIGDILDDAVGQDLSSWLASFGLVIVGSAVVFGPLLWLARHPRTRGALADFASISMKVMMFVAGLVCLAGGMFNSFGLESFAEEVAAGVLAAAFMTIPIVLQLVER